MKNTMISTENSKERETMYKYILRQKSKVGGKDFSYIPVELLFSDDSYQRDEYVNEGKINMLAAHFDERKMDALKVSARDSFCAFAVIDGMHRLEAAKRLGVDLIECEILSGLTVKDEALLFATQNDDVDILTPGQKHKANLVLEVPECVNLERVCNEYGIRINRRNGRGWQPVGTLQSYTDAIRITRKHGEIGLDYIFDVLRDAKYFEERGGLSSYVLGGLDLLYTAHLTNTARIKRPLVKILRSMPPKILKAEAIAHYPMRNARAAVALYLEEELAREMALELSLHHNMGTTARETATIS